MSDSVLVARAEQAERLTAAVMKRSVIPSLPLFLLICKALTLDAAATSRRAPLESTNFFLLKLSSPPGQNEHKITYVAVEY